MTMFDQIFQSIRFTFQPKAKAAHRKRQVLDRLSIALTPKSPRDIRPNIVLYAISEFERLVMVSPNSTAIRTVFIRASMGLTLDTADRAMLGDFYFTVHKADNLYHAVKDLMLKYGNYSAIMVALCDEKIEAFVASDMEAVKEAIVQTDHFEALEGPLCGC